MFNFDSMIMIKKEHEHEEYIYIYITVRLFRIEWQLHLLCPRNNDYFSFIYLLQ
jgi:hypothetical protein